MPTIAFDCLQVHTLRGIKEPMKTCAFIWVALSLLLFTIATRAQSFLTNGLVAYYPFNGNANDESGNGYNGTPASLTYGRDRFGQPSAAAVFDGLSSSITVFGLRGQNFLPVTFSVWINGAPSNNSDVGVIGNYAIASAAGTGVFATLDYLHAWYFGARGNVYDEQGGLNSGNTLDSSWHQIVVTYDDSGGVIYKDGAALKSLTWIGKPSSSISQFTFLIGEYAASDGSQMRFFHGSLDDIRIYSRVLSSSEVAELFNFEGSPIAQAIAFVTNDFVSGINLSYGGCSYTNTPSVRFIGGGGSGAATPTPLWW